MIETLGTILAQKDQYFLVFRELAKQMGIAHKSTWTIQSRNMIRPVATVGDFVVNRLDEFAVIETSSTLEMFPPVLVVICTNKKMMRMMAKMKFGEEFNLDTDRCEINFLVARKNMEASIKLYLNFWIILHFQCKSWR